MTSKKKQGIGGGGGPTTSPSQKKKCEKCPSGGGEVSSKVEVFKKGPWTAEEDSLLVEYVKNHGERQWNCVQKTGLMRCGKSCRLRWTNHLRPDLKKGAFSTEEEKIVIELHQKLGNKWSKIAAKLPGRTDNEVKNFWNTKIKRKLRNGSLEISEENLSPSQQDQTNNEPHPNPPPISNSIPLFSPVSLSLNTNPNPDPFVDPPTTFSFTDPTNDSSTEPGINLNKSAALHGDPIMSFLNNPAYRFDFSIEEDYDRNNFLFPQNFSSFSMLPVSQDPSLFHPNPNPFPRTHLLEFESNPACYQPNPLPSLGAQMGYESPVLLPSFQGEPKITQTNADSSIYNHHCFSGYVLGNEGWNDSRSLGAETTLRVEEGKLNGYNGGEMTSVLVGNEKGHGSFLDATSSSHGALSSSDIRQRKRSAEEMESMDDELSSLLSTFSSCGPPPEWYLTTGGDRLLDNTMANYNQNRQDATTSSSGATAATTSGSSSPPPVMLMASSELNWSSHGGYRNNMSGVS